MQQQLVDKEKQIKELQQQNVKLQKDNDELAKDSRQKIMELELKMGKAYQLLKEEQAKTPKESKLHKKTQTVEK